jgi:hypothetical protein
MNKTTTIKALLIFGILLLNSCNKKCKEITQISIQNEFAKPFFDFQSGSYWIYLNTTDSVTDSVYINDINSYYYPPDDPENETSITPRCYQIEMKYYSLINDGSINISVKAREHLDDDGNIIGFGIGYYDIMKHLTYNLSFNSSNECVIGENIGSVTIGSMQFDNVYKIKSTYYNYPINYSELYICKDVGVIKMVSDDYIKELVNYKIN